MNKQEQLAAPIKPGDRVTFEIKYEESITARKGKNVKTELVQKTKSGYGDVKEVQDNLKHGLIYLISTETSIPYQVEIKGMPNYFRAEWVKPWIRDCGSNPFKPSPRINFTNSSIESILSKMGYGRKSLGYEKPEYEVCTGNVSDDKGFAGCTYGGVNFDPYVFDKDGNKQFYQRGLVWTTEQKQLLIESIYSGIEIGKFLFRYKSWEQIREQMAETRHGFNYDCVDGKQRMHALLEFVQNKFPDLHGNYFDDLSESAAHDFLNYNRLAVGTMDESTDDKQVIAGFLHLNFTGVPMSKEHIAHVQQIKI